MDQKYRLNLYHRTYLIVLLLIGMFTMIQCRDFTFLKSNTKEKPDSQPQISAEKVLHYYSVPNSPWKDVIIYAHGYVDPTTPAPTIPNDQIDGRYIGDIINSLGYAFATTSYPGNGLIIPAAVTDIKKLADEFKAHFPQTQNIYLVGVSEGGLVTAKVIESYPDTFSGGIAGCGPVGDFQKQLNYFGNFHVLFHHFYPGIGLPGMGIGNPDNVPDTLITLWLNGTLENEIKSKINFPYLSLFKVAGVPIDNTADMRSTLMEILRYNLLATDNAIKKLGGSSFDNTNIYYHGTGDPQNDLKLNRVMPRFRADSSAIKNINDNYQTTGKLKIPLVTVHNIEDPIVPYFHEQLYEQKVELQGSKAFYDNIPVKTFGHCNFQISDLIGAFAVLLNIAGKQKLQVNPTIFPDHKQLEHFLQIARQTGTKPNFTTPKKLPVVSSFKHGYLNEN